MNPQPPTTAAADGPLFRSPRRILLATLGVLCVGLAGLGVIVPGMPTTVFLIAASYLFTRSCPVLERVLIRNRFFGPFLQYLDGTAAMPVVVVRRTLLIMWVCVGISTALLFVRGTQIWICLVPIVLAVVGHVFICRLRR